MIRSLWTAATGMAAQQLNIDVISNNLANVNTPGFKKSRVDFQDLLYQTLRTAGTTEAQGSMVPTGIQVGLGTRPAAITRIFSQGDFQQTNNPLDLVIEGDGFFQVLLPNGTTAYTRDGTFKLDSQGRIVTADGYPLDPEITIPAEATSISIGSDGTVSVTMAGQTTPQELGQIQIAKFINPAGLNNLGRNLLAPTAASGEPIVDTPGLNGLGTIAHGFVEMSNVKVVEEMVNMIVAQRAYEVNSKAIQTADDMLSIANNLRR
ncbi:MAG: flagellar basal-body rod protein FlgG [Armatimonadota bacterium]|nr:flagellar basal-body rod protein FlgG [Armatimonadota bacterium]MDH7481941.1 flagellar basal-body rod protein FlgG [Armatimonadota bacterium]